MPERSADILFMCWNHDVSKRVLAFARGREQAKRKAHRILGGDKDAYTVEPLTRPGIGVGIPLMSDQKTETVAEKYDRLYERLVDTNAVLGAISRLERHWQSVASGELREELEERARNLGHQVAGLREEAGDA